MKKVAASHRPQVELKRCLHEQLGYRRVDKQLGANGPDTQKVGTKLQLGTQHQGNGGIAGVRGRRANKGSALVEAAVIQSAGITDNPVGSRGAGRTTAKALGL